MNRTFITPAYYQFEILSTFILLPNKNVYMKNSVEFSLYMNKTQNYRIKISVHKI